MSTTAALFADEFLVHRRYLRAVLHLRPVIAVDTAEIVMPGARIPLLAQAHKHHVQLEADAIIPGILDANEAVVVVRSGGKVLEFRDFVQADLLAHDRLAALTSRLNDNLLSRLGSLDVLEVGSRLRGDTKGHLDMRSRARSYVGMDILPGPNVDMVGDAHKLASLLGEQRFDFVYSQWVWEHLAMPWVACAELNRVMRPGAEAFILTNHTMPLHDLPWDFFRFSQSTWIALFNEQTGFEIIDSAMGDGMRIVPYRYRPAHVDHEGGLGYLGTGCWVRKVSHSKLTWPVEPDFIYSKLSRAYPTEITD
jgi:hypothetical protein